jgi:hypothetical protein
MKPEPAALEIDELAQRLLERGLQAEPELFKMRLRMVRVSSVAWRSATLGEARRSG